MTYLDPKQIPVPSQDSASNSYIQDVVGNKTDTHAGDSLYAGVETLLDHVHKPSKVYPTLATGVTLNTNAAAWTLGTVTEIIPASTITSDFDIHRVSIESLDDIATYEIVLYYGAGDTECGRVRFSKTSNQDTAGNQPIQTPIIPANSRVRGAVASSTGSSVAVVSLYYHTY